jgi:hypothetical protein
MGFLNPKENEAVVKALGADAETLHRILIKPGNAAAYTELKNSIGEQGARPVKQAFTNHLMGEGGKDVGGLANLRSTLDRYGSQTLAEVYNPQEVKQLYNLADKSQWMKHSPVGNPFFREMVKSNPAQVAPSILSDEATTAKVIRAFPQMKPHLRQAFMDGVHPNEKTPFPTKLLERLNSYPKGTQQHLFTSGELQDFHQLAKIIERTKGSVKLAENPSGTAQNVIAHGDAMMMLKHPLTAAPQVAGVSAIAKLYLSQTGRRLLMEGLVTPSNSKRGAEIGFKIGTIIGADAHGRLEEQGQRARSIPIEYDEED